ncbi:MAG: extracellular solute-binding protein [Lachnospiraceae bacterium]|nr:extracellular solute-binding protein [Lachnospiraceae bacterium]
MKRKFLALLLTVSTCLSLLTGCGNGNAEAVTADQTAENDQQTAEGEEGLIPITFCRTQSSTEESDIFAKLDGESYEDNRWTRIIEEQLGIDVQYLWIASSAEQQTQKFNAAVAAQSIPDIVCVDKITLKNLVEAGQVVDLKPYYDQYASDLLKSMIDAAGEQCIQACTFADVQYGIPYVDCDLETAQMLWLRQDWMDELNLEAPETTEDLKEIIRAFMAKVGDGAVGMALCNDLHGVTMGIKGWCNGYGAYPGYWVEGSDGQLVYGSTTQEMKEALSGLAGLYEEGLLDQEFYVNDGTKSAEALVSGKCGVMYGWHATPLWPLQDNIDQDPAADWKPYRIVTGKEGETIRPGINMMTSTWYAVSKNCQHPEALIQLLNLYCEKVFDPEKNEYSYYANPGGGLEGVWRLSPVTLNSANKNQQTALAIATPLETGDPGDLYGEQLSMYEYSKAALDGDTTLWGWNRVFGKDGSQQLLLRYQQDTDVELVSDAFYGASTETMTTRKSTLDSMLNETFFKIISCQISLEEFDKTVAAWYEAGGQDMTNEVNQWYQEQ